MTAARGRGNSPHTPAAPRGRVAGSGGFGELVRAAAGTYFLVLERQGRGWRIRSHLEHADLDLLEQQTATTPAPPETAPAPATGT